MTIKEVTSIYKVLSDKHNCDFELTFNNRKRWSAYCNVTERVISLSNHYIKYNCVEMITNTILHEIAHALTPTHHHDIVWKNKFKEIGGNGERCNTNSVMKYKWNAICPNCKMSTGMHRKSKVKSACFNCCTKHNGGVFSEKFLLTYKESK